MKTFKEALGLNIMYILTSNSYGLPNKAGILFLEILLPRRTI